MRKKILRSFWMVLFCLTICPAWGQSTFRLPMDEEKAYIPFELVNNLVVIPVKVNGAKLHFILDTGVSSTILFAFKEVDSVEVRNVQPVKLRGLGGGNSVDALKSEGNRLEIGGAVNTTSTLYVIFDEDLNFSPRMGTSINGIIGNDFFKNFVVKTNYVSRRITIFKPEAYRARRCKKCITFPLSFHNNKPYFTITAPTETGEEPITLLIDSGSSDALWLFDQTNRIDTIQKNYFDDFLGLGLSGGIFGKRSKISEIRIGDFSLSNVKVAYPDPVFLENIKFYEERDGSMGGDILKRFTVTMNYSDSTMILKKNANFRAPFHYNMSGLIIEHDGMVMIKDFERIRSTNTRDEDTENRGVVVIQMSTIMNQLLAPRYVVAEVRENSVAADAGILKGDEVISVNGKLAHKYKLHELISLFTSEEDKLINMRIERFGRKFYVKFRLKKVI